jgi:hypothetical protein
MVTEYGHPQRSNTLGSGSMTIETDRVDKHGKMGEYMKVSSRKVSLMAVAAWSGILRKA